MNDGRGRRREKEKGMEVYRRGRASLTLTGSAVCFLFRSLSLWCGLTSAAAATATVAAEAALALAARASSACCFLSSLRWLSVSKPYTMVIVRAPRVRYGRYTRIVKGTDNTFRRKSSRVRCSFNACEDSYENL